MAPPNRRLPPLPTVSDIIRLYGLSAQQKLSQNFILDSNLTDKIARLGNINSCTCVCEVGAGPGALTRSILNNTQGTVVAIEKDKRFLPSLELLSDATDGRLQVCHGDAQEFDWEKSCDNHVTPKPWEDISDLSIVGNLPFSVSIPLLLQWLQAIPRREGPFKYGRTSMTLTFQKEVAERITAPINHPQRSRLSIMVQHLCHIKWGFVMKPAAFVPRPKVEAVVLRLTPHITPLVNVNYYTLERVVKATFQYRRKMIRHGAKLLFPTNPQLSKELFLHSGISDSLRSQQLTLQDYEALTNAYTTLTNKHIINSQQ